MTDEDTNFKIKKSKEKASKIPLKYGFEKDENINKDNVIGSKFKVGDKVFVKSLNKNGVVHSITHELANFGVYEPTVTVVYDDSFIHTSEEDLECVLVKE